MQFKGTIFHVLKRVELNVVETIVFCFKTIRLVCFIKLRYIKFVKSCKQYLAQCV